MLRAAERRQKPQIGAVREGSWEEEALRVGRIRWVKQGGQVGKQNSGAEASEWERAEHSEAQGRLSVSLEASGSHGMWKSRTFMGE